MIHTLSRRVKIAYGIGDMGSALTGAMISVIFAVFLTDVVGLRPAYAALIVFVGRTWEYVTDPIVGYVANQTRTRWGTYRPYLLFGSLPFGISFAMLWWVPPISNALSLLVYYTVVYSIYVATMNLVSIPYMSMTPRITSDYDERTSLTSYRMVFSLAGSMIAFVVPLAIIGDIVPQNTDLILIVGFTMAVISSAPYLVTFLGTTEVITSSNQEKISIKQSVVAAAKNKPFLIAVLLYLLTITGFEVTSVMTFYFFKYSLGVKESTDIFLGIMFIAAMFSVPLWNHVSGRLDKTQAFIIGIGLSILLRLIITVLQPNTAMPLLILLMALGGIAFASGQTLPWAIIPDTIEYDEYLTGQRHEGIFYSFMQLARGIAVSLAIPGVLLLLDLSGYSGSAVMQTDAVDRTIRILFGAVPSILFAFAIVAALFYPLNRQKFQSIKDELEKKKS